MKRILALTVLILLISGMVALFVFGVLFFVSEYSTPTAFSEEVQSAAFKYGIDANLIYAIIKAESKFDEDAVSKKGARGLMQLMPATEKFVAQRLGYGADGYDIFDPSVNVEFGCHYFAYLLERFEGKTELALCAYNAGEGNVALWLARYGVNENGALKKVPFKETKEYLGKVLNYYRRYRMTYNY